MWLTAVKRLTSPYNLKVADATYCIAGQHPLLPALSRTRYASWKAMPHTVSLPNKVKQKIWDRYKCEHLPAFKSVCNSNWVLFLIHTTLKLMPPSNTWFPSKPQSHPSVTCKPVVAILSLATAKISLFEICRLSADRRTLLILSPLSSPIYFTN